MPLTRRTADNGVTFYASPLLERAGVPHAFSTRVGGVSPAPFDSLNLGIAGGTDLKDTQANLDENYRRLAVAAGGGLVGRERCWVSQVHGADVCHVAPAAAFTSGVNADALVTADPARMLSVKYADCVPILLATADGRAVAAVHAGWRGVIAGVIGAAAARLRDLAGAPEAPLLAAVGPCISAPHFEVGPVVAAEFERAFGAAAPIAWPRGSAGKPHVDLVRAVRLQLGTLGIGDDRADSADLCTFANAGEFFSHRRDGPATGRMAVLVAPAA
ncbi:MAG TPA: polyphenol oxidase family protein [Tepidisphaeraceae bacterium]|nr:polyphenol oxidase family protein [Tepidisphaeraceae bacterium]